MIRKGNSTKKGAKFIFIFMKKNVPILFIVMMSNYSIAQKSTNLNGKIFRQIDQIPNSTTDLMFISNTEVVYIITNAFNGKTFVDECPGKSTFINNKVNINCISKTKKYTQTPLRIVLFIILNH